MNHYKLQIAKERQAEIRREAQLYRLTRNADQQKPISYGWKLSSAVVFTIVIVFLTVFLV